MNRSRSFAAASLAALVITTSACAHTEPAEEPSRSGFSAGLTLDTDPTARNVGLPIMPGAVKRMDKNKDGESEGSGVNFSLWGGIFGLKVVVLQLSSPEPASRVAEYYRRELARHGEVIDCSANASNPGPKKAARDKDGNKLTLDCGKESTKAGEYVMKVGTAKNFRLVNVEPRGNEVHINLVRINAKVD